jgi:hypothetical protein
MPKHVHCELIKAWADGAEIEFFNPFSEDWKTTPAPKWNLNVQYRVKPKEPKYKVGDMLMSNDFKVFEVLSIHRDNFENISYKVHNLTTRGYMALSEKDYIKRIIISEPS